MNNSFIKDLHSHSADLAVYGHRIEGGDGVPKGDVSKVWPEARRLGFKKGSNTERKVTLITLSLDLLNVQNFTPT